MIKRDSLIIPRTHDVCTIDESLCKQQVPQKRTSDRYILSVLHHERHGNTCAKSLLSEPSFAPNTEIVRGGVERKCPCVRFRHTFKNPWWSKINPERSTTARLIAHEQLQSTPRLTKPHNPHHDTRLLAYDLMRRFC